MAPAEMVRAGMIVWVPNGGGQVEIVGGAPELRYDSREQAIEQITRVVSEPREQQRLREHLAARADRFSAEHFMHRVRGIVADFRE